MMMSTSVARVRPVVKIHWKRVSTWSQRRFDIIMKAYSEAIDKLREALQANPLRK